MEGAWHSPIYRETVAIVLGFLFASGIVVYFLRQLNYYFVVSWASIKSWLIAAPFLMLVLGAPDPYPLIVLTLIAIFGAKAFFQILGVYHRSYFVLLCYAGIIGLAFAIREQRKDIYNLMPMIELGLICLIPLVRNNYRRMIQYIALTLLAFIFMGWSFMHLGLIMQLEKGIYQVMYLIILTEFCDNTNLAVSRYIGKTKMFPKIDPKRSLEGLLFSSLITVAIAFAMRHLLSDGSERYWLAAGLIASFAGVFGDLVMTVIRRDLGIRDYGAFVIGRGDLLQRMDRLIFVAPIYYYVMQVI